MRNNFLSELSPCWFLLKTLYFLWSLCPRPRSTTNSILISSLYKKTFKHGGSLFSPVLLLVLLANHLHLDANLSSDKETGNNDKKCVCKLSPSLPTRQVLDFGKPTSLILPTHKCGLVWYSYSICGRTWKSGLQLRRWGGRRIIIMGMGNQPTPRIRIINR